MKEERRERQRRQALRQELVALLDLPERSVQQERQDQLDHPRDPAEGRRGCSRFFFLPADEEAKEEEEDETDERKTMDVLGVPVQLLFLMSLAILFFSIPLFGAWVMLVKYWIILFPGR